MTQMYEVKKTRKDPTSGNIIAICGENDDGTQWEASSDDAMFQMGRNQRIYYVLDQNGGKTELRTARDINGNDHLTTNADSTESNNLRCLPDC
jgi:hypothetical protein